MKIQPVRSRGQHRRAIRRLSGGEGVEDVDEADDVNEVEEDDDVQDSVYDDEEGGAVSDLPAMSLIKPPTRQAGMPAYRYPVAEINSSILSKFVKKNKKNG